MFRSMLLGAGTAPDVFCRRHGHRPPPMRRGRAIAANVDRVLIAEAVPVDDAVENFHERRGGRSDGDR